MNTRTIKATHGNNTPCTVYVYDQRDGSAWYAVEDSNNVNQAPDGSILVDGVNVETIEDMDTSTGGPIDSEEALVAHVDDEEQESNPEEVQRLKRAAEAQLDAIVERYDATIGPRDRAAVREQLNNTADAFSRNEIEEAELRDRITSTEAEQLRDRVHAMAANRHPGQ